MTQSIDVARNSDHNIDTLENIKETSLFEIEKLADSPYKGLNPYDETDNKIFFGRNKDIQKVVNSLMAWPLTILYGKSGVGKSSLLRAGVTHILNEEALENIEDYGVPKLAVVVFPSLERGFDWQDDPLTGLMQQIEAMISRSGWNIESPETGLSFIDTLRAWTETLGGEEKNGQLFIILDQFEDYFQYHSLEDRQKTQEKFAVEFASAVNSDLPVNFLISIRDDSFDKLDHFKRYIPDLFEHTVGIKHLDQKSAYQALKEPIKVYNSLVPSNKSVKIKSTLIKSILEGVNQFSPIENGRAGEKPESKTTDFSTEPNLTKDLAIEEYDLNVRSLNNDDNNAKSLLLDLPSEGENLVVVAKIVATIGDSYHVRIFDKNGRKVIDKGDDEFLPDKTIAQELDVALSKQPISDQKFSKVELIEKIISTLDHAPGLQIEAPYLQLVMTRLWEEMNPTSRCLDLDLLMNFADKRFTANQNKKIKSAIQKISREHLDTALDRLSDHEKDILANLFQYLVTPSGTKYAYSLSDLYDNYDNYVSDFADKEDKEELKCTKSELSILLETLAKGKKRVICPRPPLPNQPAEGKRFEIFHDVLAQPILDWRRLHLVRKQREKEREKEHKEAKQLRIRSIKQGLAAQSLRQQRRREDELAALLACQAYNFNQHDRLYLLAQVDDSLRQALSAPYFSNILKHGSVAFSSIAFSPDGKKLAAGSWDGNIYLWNQEQHYSECKPLAVHKKGINNKGINEIGINAIAFSLDGEWLVSGSRDNTIIRWDLCQKHPVSQVIGRHKKDVTSVAFSPNGNLLASGSKDQTVKLWKNWQQPKQRPIVLKGYDSKGKMGAVRSLTFSPDNSTLAVGCESGAIWLWDVQKPTQKLDKEPVVLDDHDKKTGHDKKIRSVAFSPDGRWLASGSDDYTIRIWDMTQPQELPKILEDRTHKTKGKVRSVAFSFDGRILASASDDQTIRLWKTDQLDEAPQILRGHTFNISSVAFSPDDLVLASSAWDNTLRLWDLNRPIAAPKILEWHQKTVRAIAISPQYDQDHMLASGSEDGTVRVWNLKQPDAEPKTFECGGKVFGVALFVSNDRQIQLLAAGSNDKIVRLWDLKQPSDKPPRQFTGHQDGVSSVAFSPDGRWLASGSWKEDTTVRLWALDQPDLEPIIFKGHTNSVTSVKISPNGKILASASDDNTVLLWNPEKPDAEPIPLKNHSGRVWSIDFSPDGQLLASASDDWTVRLWDLRNLDLEHPDLNNLVHISLRGHSAWVSSVAFRSDGEVLASGSFDRSIRLWQIDQIEWKLGIIRENPIVLEDHYQSVTSVAFTPDGKYLASGSFDNTARLWIARTEDLADMVCQKVLRNLTQDEWQQFMGDDIPYELTCPTLPQGE